MNGYLVDTSVWHRMDQSAVRDRVEQLHLPTYTCLPVTLEIGVSARHADEHAELIDDLTRGAHWAAITADIERRAVQVQRLLAARNHHRAARLADLLIAVTAEAHDLVVLHYDSDYDLIADVTGQPCEWVVPRGSVT